MTRPCLYRIRLVTGLACAAFTAIPGAGHAAESLVQEAIVHEATAPGASTEDGGATADSGALDPIQQRAEQLARLFGPAPGAYGDVFTPAFLEQVPADELDRIFTRTFDRHGRATDAEILGPLNAAAVIVRLHFEDESAALLQLSLDPSPPHLVSAARMGPVFATADPGASKQLTLRVRDPEYETDDYETGTSLRLPFEGEWWVFWGGRSLADNYHRASAHQRYAYDFVIRRNGSTHRGAGDENADYFCHGAPILAPAAGVVVAARDGIADNVPGELNGRRKLGNHVVIDHGSGEYSLLAHLRNGSVAVSDGDTLAAGDRVGECGNSGNSSEPHLHYQLQTDPDFYSGRSVPAPFHGYLSNGERVQVGEPRRGETIVPAD